MGQSTNSFWSLLCAQCDPSAVLPISHDKARSLYLHCTKEETSSERRAIAQNDRTRAGRSLSGYNTWALATMPCGSATATKLCAECSKEVSSWKAVAPQGQQLLPPSSLELNPMNQRQSPIYNLSFSLRTWLIYSLENYGCLWARALRGDNQDTNRDRHVCGGTGRTNLGCTLADRVPPPGAAGGLRPLPHGTRLPWRTPFGPAAAAPPPHYCWRPALPQKPRLAH